MSQSDSDSDASDCSEQGVCEGRGVHAAVVACAARAVRASLALSSRTTRLLDVGCGAHAHVSRRLAPYVQSVVALDTSLETVGAINAAARNQGLAVDEFQAVHWQHAHPSPRRPDAVARVDVILFSRVLHHVADPRRLVHAIVADWLAADGCVIIIDLAFRDHYAHLFATRSQAMLSKQGICCCGGFKEEAVDEWMIAAGLAICLDRCQSFAVRKHVAAADGEVIAFEHMVRVGRLH